MSPSFSIYISATLNNQEAGVQVCIANIGRSTNLDSWSLAQLRTMKVGGNSSIADFFTKHGGSSLLPPANTDARGRYTSRQAGLYKEELARRILADERL